MADIGDGHREAVRPVALAVTDRKVAAVARDLVRTWPDELVHPALGTAAEGDSQRRPPIAASLAIARAARPVPRSRPLCRPFGEGRARTRAAVDPTVGGQSLE